MRRIGVLLLVGSLLMLFFVSGCKESETVAETGFELVTENCIAIGIRVFIDGEYKEMASADQPHFFPLPAGTYDFFARSNATLSINDPDPLCWTRQIEIDDGVVTQVILYCDSTDVCNE